MNLRTSLYSHQQAAVDKLLPARVGALFCEMGTGKTRMAIELVARRRARIRNVLWFCPVSLKETIRHEIAKHTDCCDRDIYVFNERTRADNLPVALWYIIGIESMSASKRVVVAARSLIGEDSFVIVDESSYIKGHSAKRTRRITGLSECARYRLLLTGTPISQGVEDLFAQMRFLSPKILGYTSFYSFAANHLEYSKRHKGLVVRAHNTEYLAAKIQPYVYQVTKEECVDLPKKLYERRYYGMTDVQRQLYEETKEFYFQKLMDAPEFRISYIVFQLFTRLQQIVCGFCRREQRTVALPHKRLSMLEDVLDNLPEDEPVVIWSKYIYNLNEIVQMLQGKYGEGAVAQFHGGLNERQRNAELERFRNGARYLVATQMTGGHGLTLNEAAYHVFYANGFKYAERIQAEDRSHRIGQTRPVTYIDLYCDRSIDERIERALAKKANVVDEFKAEVERVRKRKDGALEELVQSL